MNSKLMPSLVSIFGIIGFTQVPGFAHGRPEHGGAFIEVREYTIEVVSKEKEEEKEERAEKEKRPHTEPMSFTIYVKDPKLKPVTDGAGSLKISEGKKQVAEAPLSASGNAFKADATLPHHGRYRVAVDFTPPGKKPLRASVPIRVE
jgi:hypothetical protein